MTQESKDYIKSLKQAYKDARMTASQIVAAIKEYSDVIFYTFSSEDWAELRFDYVDYWVDIAEMEAKK